MSATSNWSSFSTTPSSVRYKSPAIEGSGAPERRSTKTFSPSPFTAISSSGTSWKSRCLYACTIGPPATEGGVAVGVHQTGDALEFLKKEGDGADADDIRLKLVQDADEALISPEKKARTRRCGTLRPVEPCEHRTRGT